MPPAAENALDPPDRAVDWAQVTYRLLAEEKWEEGLRYITMCLETDPSDLEPHGLTVSPKELQNLLDKRSLLHIRFVNYESAVEDAQKSIKLDRESVLARKCLLIALCRMNEIGRVKEAMKAWEMDAPNNIEMIESRTKLTGLLDAILKGIEAQCAFSNIEEGLKVDVDALLKRKFWRYRPFPGGVPPLLCLQHKYGMCHFRTRCPDAHGPEELEEWKDRYFEKSENEKNTLPAQNESIIKSLLAQISNAGEECKILLEENEPAGIRIKAREALKLNINSKNLKPCSWKFAVEVETQKPMVSVCLLHDLHRHYFKIESVQVQIDKTKKQAPIDKEGQSCELVINDEETSSAKLLYSVKVTFTPELLGSFRQTIVFDFGEEQKPARNLTVAVYPFPDEEEQESGTTAGQSELASPKPAEDKDLLATGNSTWNFGNADILHSNDGERVSFEKLGFALISGAPRTRSPIDGRQGLTKDNYKEKMRDFLLEEEKARQEIIANYNLSALLKVSKSYELTSGAYEGENKFAVDGCLYGQMTLFRDISEDTAVGRLILRSCNCVLLTTTENAKQEKPRVFLCDISDKTKNSIYIHLGAACVEELSLKNGDSIPFDIQFQLDRTAFTEQKCVIDQLTDTHLDFLFPDFSKNYNIPWTPELQWDSSDRVLKKLNPKQKESLIAITSENTEIPPILLIGPFGTGKTFTLAQCVRKILASPSSRVMICTQSNSAADLYIKEYLDKWYEEDGIEEAKPLRVYYTYRSFKTVSQQVLKYCITENGRFRLPTKEDIMSHRVIVVTLGTSYMLAELELEEDTFSHILLDEAAQAMESEAITPILAAGKKTKLVLAGDHMQLSPELFCDQAKNFHPSLLERLHHLYPDAHPCKLMLCENYRSHSAIIKFASACFYDSWLKSGMDQPVHPQIYPLTFYAARGEDNQESDSTSYYNMSEVYEVCQRVKEIVENWPKRWGPVDHENSIGVLTPYSDQVLKIRAQLRKMKLFHVSVERVLNVQGKQFRAVFLCTVRTLKPWVRILPDNIGDEVDLGFFSNPKLLNTALTRAQSLVAIVGDPVSLCSVGKCRVLWTDFIKICSENGSLHGITHLQLTTCLLGFEMRLQFGFNPFADEFKPKRSLAASNLFSRVLQASLSPSNSNSKSQLKSLKAVAPKTTAVPKTTPPPKPKQVALSNIGTLQSAPAPPPPPLMGVQSIPPLMSIPTQTGYVQPVQMMYPHPPPAQYIVNTPMGPARVQAPGYLTRHPGERPVYMPVRLHAPNQSSMAMMPYMAYGPGPYFAQPPHVIPHEMMALRMRHPLAPQGPSVYIPPMATQNLGPPPPNYQYQSTEFPPLGPQGQMNPHATQAPPAQMRVNTEHVSGVPLYLRPSELQHSVSPQPPASPRTNARNRMEAAVASQHVSLTPDDFKLIKEALDGVNPSKVDNAHMQNLYTKLGISVSNEFPGVQLNSSSTSGYSMVGSEFTPPVEVVPVAPESGTRLYARRPNDVSSLSNTPKPGLPQQQQQQHPPSINGYGNNNNNNYAFPQSNGPPKANVVHVAANQFSEPLPPPSILNDNYARQNIPQNAMHFGPRNPNGPPAGLRPSQGFQTPPPYTSRPRPVVPPQSQPTSFSGANRSYASVLKQPSQPAPPRQQVDQNQLLAQQFLMNCEMYLTTNNSQNGFR